mmetsp:Transcript_45936/g.74942  ORF Transcript_45936/g.74942 Transcript_45936/m.74942 type:complete len:225 (-) Transcript_45936:461-1135(-)
MLGGDPCGDCWEECEGSGDMESLRVKLLLFGTMHTSVPGPTGAEGRGCNPIGTAAPSRWEIMTPGRPLDVLDKAHELISKFFAQRIDTIPRIKVTNVTPIPPHARMKEKPNSAPDRSLHRENAYCLHIATAAISDAITAKEDHTTCHAIRHAPKSSRWSAIPAVKLQNEKNTETARQANAAHPAINNLSHASFAALSQSEYIAAAPSSVVLSRPYFISSFCWET